MQDTGSWQSGKLAAASLISDINKDWPDIDSTRADLAKEAPFALAPTALNDYQMSVDLYVESFRMAIVAARLPPGAMQSQLQLSTSRIRELGDRIYDQATAVLSPYAPPLPNTNGNELIKPADVPVWASVRLAAGPPLDAPPPSFAQTDRAYYYVVLAVAIACAGIVVGVRRSRLGRLMGGLADSPLALDAHGADTRIVRLYVFCVSAFVAAIGGAALAAVTQSVNGSPTSPYGYFNSVVLVAVLAFSGRRALWSPVVAAFVLEVLKVYKPFSEASFVKFQGVGFGLLALGVAIAPAVIGSWSARRAAERSAAPDRLQARVAAPPQAEVLV